MESGTEIPELRSSVDTFRSYFSWNKNCLVQWFLQASFAEQIDSYMKDRIYLVFVKIVGLDLAFYYGVGERAEETIG